MKRDVKAPLDQLEQQTNTLSNMQSASNLLRQVRYYLTYLDNLKKLTSKHQGETPSSRELSKMSQVVRDLEKFNYNDIMKVKVVQRERAGVEKVSLQVCVLLVYPII